MSKLREILAFAQGAVGCSALLVRWSVKTAQKGVRVLGPLRRPMNGVCAPTTDAAHKGVRRIQL